MAIQLTKELLKLVQHTEHIESCQPLEILVKILNSLVHTNFTPQIIVSMTLYFHKEIIQPFKKTLSMETDQDSED